MAPKPGLTWIWNQIRQGIKRNIADLGSGIGDPAGFIADDSITPGPARNTQIAMRYVCRQWARGTLPATDLADAVNGSLCRQYLENIGEYPDQEGGFDAPPGFSGGQCEGVAYLVSGTFTNSVTRCDNGQPAGGNGNQFSVGPATVVGPISNIRWEPSGDSCNGNPTTQTLKATDGQGSDVVIGAISTSFPGQVWVGTPGTVQISVARQDGQPDVCGDPDPRYRPPSFKPGLPPIDPPELPTPIGPYIPDIRFEPDGPKIYPPDGGEPFEILPSPEGDIEECRLRTMEVLVAVLVVQVQPPTRDDGAFLTGDYYLFARAGNLQWINTESGARSDVYEIKVNRQVLTNPDPYVYDDYIISPALGAELSATGILGRVPDYAFNGE